MNAPQQQPRDEFWMEDVEALIDERWGDFAAEHRLLDYAKRQRIAALRMAGRS